MRNSFPRQCYVDESVHADCRFVVSAFVFAASHIDTSVASILRDVGLEPCVDEYKSGTRMTGNVPMQQARERLLALANSSTRIGIFVGNHDRATFGRHSLQALQSMTVRNAIRPSQLDVYFDGDIFVSPQEARRLHALFHHLKAARIHPKENSKTRLGIQVADAVAASFGRIVKERLTGATKEIDIGGPDTGYEPGTMAPLGWSLLMSLRHALLTRPVVCNGAKYSPAADPVILDSERDDIVTYAQHPVLLGWGVQIAPDATDELRRAVEQSLGRIWLGCVH